MPGGFVNISSNQLIGTSGSKQITGIITIPTPVIATQEIDLSTGALILLSIPVAATVMFIAPSSSNTGPLVIAGQTSGQYVSISPSQPSLLSLPSTKTSTYLGTGVFGNTGIVEVSYA